MHIHTHGHFFFASALFQRRDSKSTSKWILTSIQYIKIYIVTLNRIDMLASITREELFSPLFSLHILSRSFFIRNIMFQQIHPSVSSRHPPPT